MDTSKSKKGLNVDNEARRFKKLHENFSYYNFLEKESLRLNHLCEFFEHKLPNFVEINQSERLIEIQERKNHEIQKLILEEIVKDNSNLQLYLAHLFNQTF